MSERCAARVLIVGAGLTGALTARRLRQQLPLAHLVIWDAAPAAGGRMRCERALGALTDSGAQYVTQVVSSEGAVANRAVHEELQEQGLLVRVTGAVEGTRAADGAGASYVCPEGLDALVSAIISRASATLVCGRRAERIGLDEAGLRWEVRALAAQRSSPGLVLIKLLLPTDGPEDWRKGLHRAKGRSSERRRTDAAPGS